MKIKEVNKGTVHFIETDDEDDYCYFTRYSSSNWTVIMEESDEQVNDEETIKELEAEFQRWANEQD